MNISCNRVKRCREGGWKALLSSQTCMLTLPFTLQSGSHLLFLAISVLHRQVSWLTSALLPLIYCNYLGHVHTESNIDFIGCGTNKIRSGSTLKFSCRTFAQKAHPFFPQYHYFLLNVVLPLLLTVKKFSVSICIIPMTLYVISTCEWWLSWFYSFLERIE